MQGSKEFNRLQHDMKHRDATVSFQCSSPGILQVTEMIDGKRIHHREVQRDPGAVTEIEARYMFFAKQAEKATSNICTNQALIALMATVFMTVYGKEGLRELAEQNLAKAH